MLDHVAIDWAWLRDHLNQIIDEVNTNKPMGSSTISVDEAPNGSLLRLLSQNQAADTTTPAPAPTDTPWKITPDGELAGWHQVISFDPASAAASTQWLWGGTPKPIKTYAWVSVGLIDPATCVQTTLIILTK